ncbi:MAG: hypothetical protein KJ046_03785 [Anaerolineae bacterium]|nr:hypothetical protein [Anaerolineae bacterium]
MSKANGQVYPASANGQAYRAYLESALSVLDQLSIVDYIALPMPAPADELLAKVVSAFTGWPVVVRDQFLAGLPSDKLGLFGIFGHRAATLAVRNNDADLLRLGMIGNVIANTPIPANRNVDAALAVFHHCARKLETDPQTLFVDVAQFAAEDMAERLIAFGRRDDVSLKQFGWREIKTPEGVRYKFEW